MWSTINFLNDVVYIIFKAHSDEQQEPFKQAFIRNDSSNCSQAYKVPCLLSLRDINETERKYCFACEGVITLNS